MRKIRFIIVAILAACLVIVGSMIANSCFRKDIRDMSYAEVRTVFDQIEVGMSYSEVESVIGLKPGDYTTCPYMGCPVGSRMNGPEWKFWTCDVAEIGICFDRNGKVAESLLLDIVILRDPGWLYRLLRPDLKVW